MLQNKCGEEENHLVLEAEMFNLTLLLVFVSGIDYTNNK
jgi:hypothetical protein